MNLVVVLTLALPSTRTDHAPRARKLAVKALLLLSLFLVSAPLLIATSTHPVYASTTYTLTEWTVPTGGSGPVGLSLDPSGNCCWFVEYFSSKVSHLDPTSGTFQEWTIPTTGANPLGIAVTSVSGQLEVWGTEFSSDKIFLLSPSTGTFQEFPIHSGSGTEYVSVEPPTSQVRVWFNEISRNANGEIIYNPATPGSGTLYEDNFPGGSGSGANGVLAGSGTVWYAQSSSLVKWDRGSNQYTVWPLPTHGSAIGRFLAQDALGQIWYTQGVTDASGADNYVGVLRGDNTIKEWQIPTVGSDPRIISINSLNQQPWIAEQSANAGNGKVAVLDPSGAGNVVSSTPTTSPSAPPSAPVTAVTTTETVSTNVVTPTSGPSVGSTNGQFTEWPLGSGSQPHDVIVDSSGTIWLLESGTNKVGRLTPTTPDFTISPSTPTISVAQGASGSLSITGTSQLSFSGPVTLSVTGSVPSGVTFSAFNPNPISVPSGGTASSSLTINVGASAPVGTYTITVSGTGSSGTHSTSFALTVTASADFTLGLSSVAMTIGGGSSAPNTVTITSPSSFNSPVTLTTSSLPSGIHVSFSSNPVTPPAGGSVTSIATVSVDSGASPTIYSITITGTSGSLMHSQAFALTVPSSADFTITLTPTAVTMQVGATASSTVTVSSVNGFNSPVLLTYSWVGSAPTGVTVTVTSPITPAPGTPATSTLTVASTASSSTGTFTLALTGSSGSLSHAANLGVTLSGSACLIATASYGSAAAPEVQLLRNFRDNSIMHTQAGSSFMLAFNAWYYSFSPSVANYITTHWVERGVMRAVLYPLVGILYLTSNLYKATSAFPEFAVLLSGLVASSLIGAFYLGLPLTIIRTKVRRLRRLVTIEKYLGSTLLGALATFLIGEAFGSPLLLMISSATIVLSTMFLAAAITSSRITKKLQPQL